jgi:3-hydroxyisobutyrate dehydrogenase-like beta-hydroxyacid dehydrogenase
MRICYLGVGNMGQPMAGSHHLSIYDTREGAMRPLLERQARQAASPKELADTWDTVIVSRHLRFLQSALSKPDACSRGRP